MRWIRAESTSGRPAGRCTPRPTPATTGRRSSTTCRRCCRSKHRFCRDLCAPFDPRDEGAGMIRVILPYHLQALAGVGREVSVNVDGPVTPGSIGDAPEAGSPMLRGPIRDHPAKARRPMLRYFACGEDISFDPLDAGLPEAVASGKEPFRIVGAIAGGWHERRSRTQ